MGKAFADITSFTQSSKANAIEDSQSLWLRALRFCIEYEEYKLRGTYIKGPRAYTGHSMEIYGRENKSATLQHSAQHSPSSTLYNLKVRFLKLWKHLKHKFYRTHLSKRPFYVKESTSLAFSSKLPSESTLFSRLVRPSEAIVYQLRLSAALKLTA